MSLISYIKLILGLFLLSCSVIAAETNLRQIEIAYQNTLHAFFNQISVPDSVVALNAVDIPSSIKWFLENQMVEALTNAGVKQVLVDPGAEEKIGELEYRSLENEIHYVPITGKQFQRTVSIKLFVKYIESSGKILGSEILDHFLSDTLKTNQMKAIEDPAIPFTKGIGGRTWLTKTIEPALTLIVSGAIIMLFYFYRSK